MEWAIYKLSNFSSKLDLNKNISSAGEEEDINNILIFKEQSLLLSDTHKCGNIQPGPTVTLISTFLLYVLLFIFSPDKEDKLYKR